MSKGGGWSHPPWVRVEGGGFRVSGIGLRHEGFGFRVWGLGFGVWGLELGVWVYVVVSVVASRYAFVSPTWCRV